ncbi:hypothetical protein FRX31_007452, partial [Thalictrum thalictroides]
MTLETELCNQVCEATEVVLETNNLLMNSCEKKDVEEEKVIQFDDLCSVKIDTEKQEEKQGFYIGSIFFSKEEYLPTTTPATDVVNGSNDIAQPLTSPSGEEENISNNSLTQVDTISVAGEEAEIVFNNESTETETGSSETEIIEPVVVETRVPDHGGGNAQPSAIGRQDGVANPSNEVTDQHKTVSTWAKKISSWADEVESESSHVDRSGSVSNNTLTLVDTISVAGEEAEIVFNNESTETETGSSETEIIEPVVVETRVPDHGGGNAQPSAIGRQDGVANPSNEATDQHKTVSTWAKKPSSWADEVESESSHVDRSGSVSNNTLTVVDEAINTSSKSDTISVAGEEAEI